MTDRPQPKIIRNAARAALATLLAFGAAGAWAGPEVRDGVDAWSVGNYAAAVEVWRSSAVAGDADAQFNLAQAYILGRGVKPDRAQAAQWFRKAALQDHAAAESKYGLLLFDQGQRGEATQWLEKAARQHEPRAQLVLGTMLFNGDGVARDWPRAYALLVRAAAADVPHASEVQAQMDKVVPVEQRQQGLLLAREDELAAQRPQLPPELARAAPGTAIRTIAMPPSRVVPVATPVATLAPNALAHPQVRKAAPAPASAIAADHGGWSVQLGAFGDPANARRLWSQVAAHFPGASVRYVKAGALTRVLVGPYPSSASATRACGSIKPCVPVAP